MDGIDKLKQRGWHKSKDAQLILGDSTSRKLIRYLNKLPDKFYDKRKGQWTKHLKAVIALLGHKNWYRVYTNNISPKKNENDIYYDAAREIVPLTSEQYDNFKTHFRNKEWLFDIHWYRETGDRKGKFVQKENKQAIDHFRFRHLKIACESEFGAKSKGIDFGAAKYDFQKLLTTNAELRLMIFLIRARDSQPKLIELDRYFESTIRSYKHLKKGDVFLFIAFCRKERELIFKQIKKK